MALVVTPVRMSPDSVAALDALAADNDTTRSDLVRAAVDYLVANPADVLAAFHNVHDTIAQLRTLTDKAGRR